jgi:type IV pilus assembly protein PilA
VLARIRESVDEREEGFTLIELLVVMIIIGILAAIAVPIFLNQRQSGYDAAAKSDLRNAASLEEQELLNTGSYSTFATMAGNTPPLTESPTHNVTVTVVRFTATGGYCLSAKHASSPRTWYYDSAGQGMQPTGATGCPVTTTGTAGDSVTG